MTWKKFEKKILGYVTSAGYGYSLGRCIVYAYLPLEYKIPGTKLEIEYFGDLAPRGGRANRYLATVNKLRF